MRVLVAGWHGQVAQALAERGAARDDVSQLAVGRPALDLMDSPSIGRTLFGMSPDVIINSAAYTDVEAAETEPSRAFRLNALGSGILARHAARLGVPIIHLSTNHVFDGQLERAYREDDPAQPLNVYGRTKLESELAVAQANDRHVILRTAWVHSPYGRNFVRSMARKARNGEAVKVVEDEVGSPAYAINLADAILDIAMRAINETARDLFGVFHIANAGCVSWHGIAERIYLSQGVAANRSLVTAIKQSEYGATATRARNATLDCSKLRNIYDIALPSWEAGVDACLARLGSE